MSNSATNRDILTVTQLNRKARQLLETHMPMLWVEGELSSFAKPSSGHWYFTLKDKGAQIRCAMFKNRNQSVRPQPQQGQQILLRARVSIYEGRGDYQLIVEHMEDAGLGALHRAFDELKSKLDQEGLFAPERKQALPKIPQHIGVITSPTGAAIRDILHVLERRFPSIPVSIFPVAVQGNQAAPQIVKALNTANRLSDCDLLLVSRGGGSLEDLWPFNEETVARAIVSSRIPIISAVGHEVDFTIADFVADYRAPTPSAAAEIATPDGEAMEQQFYGLELLLQESMRRLLSQRGLQVKHLSAQLQHPGHKLQSQSQTLDYLEEHLQQTMHKKLIELNHQLMQSKTQLRANCPDEQIYHLKQKVEAIAKQFNTNINFLLSNKQQKFSQQVALLNSYNPLNTLRRGYTITRNKKDAIIESCNNVALGDSIKTTLIDGEIESKIVHINPTT